MTPLSKVVVYIDGASRGNPGPSGIGVVFVDSEEQPVCEFSRYIGTATNNIAEYSALICALQEAERKGYAQLHVRTDSQLLARQIAGQYKVKDFELQKLHALAKRLMQSFKVCQVDHIPRERNKLADRAASRAVSEKNFKTKESA